MSEIRYSKFDNRYVIIAPERFHRPLNRDCKFENSDTSKCPFCEGNEEKTPNEIFSIREGERWLTRVVPNIYKALNLETEFKSEIQGSFESFGGFGMHEIIIDTPNHISIFDFESEEYLNLFKSIQVRVEDLKRDMRIKYLAIFKNYGLNAGASQAHPHTQIVGMPILPIAKKDLFEREFKYYRKHGRKLLGDIVEEEIREDSRVLFKSRNFISFMPYASIFPFEIMVVPLEKQHSITNLNHTQLEELSLITKKSIDLLHRELEEFDLNIEFGEPPINEAFDSEEFFNSIHKFHLFYLRIRPRIFNLGGFEVANEMFINPIEPEFMRKVLKEFL